MTMHLALILLSAALVACSGQPAPASQPAPVIQPLPPINPAPSLEDRVRAAAGDVRQLAIITNPDASLSVTGQLGGAPFAVRFPENWKGGAVLYAHGYVQPTPGASEPDPAATVSSGLLSVPFSQGFAVAASGYDKVGYAVEGGAKNTLRLQRFVDEINPGRDYLVGESMGGDIVMKLIEGAPDAFAGALAACGVVGGWRAEVAYLSDFRVVYDFFTRGTPYALPGAADPLTPDPGYTLTAIQQKVSALFTAAQGGDAQARNLLVNISASAGASGDPVSYVTALASFTYGTQDYLNTAGGNGYGNVGKTYLAPTPQLTAALNDPQTGVVRLQAKAEAAAYLNANYTPNGSFKTKLLTIHNTVDPLVPIFHEALLKTFVAGAGNTDNLVQQRVTTVNAFDPKHCEFSPREYLSAWTELRAWVENGAKPEDGKDITSK